MPNTSSQGKCVGTKKVKTKPQRRQELERHGEVEHEKRQTQEKQTNKNRK